MTKAEAIVVLLAIIFALFGFVWRSYAPHPRSAHHDGTSPYGGDGGGDAAASTTSYGMDDCGSGDTGDCGGDGGGGDGGGGD
jgi:hypothetical protein